MSKLNVYAYQASKKAVKPKSLELDFDVLGSMCKMDKQDIFMRVLPELKFDVHTNTSGSLAYRQNDDAKILAVAHLDIVGSDPASYDDYGAMVNSRALDDRLGATMILELARRIPIDILFTDNEEKGKSTAFRFNPTKKYNWIFSLDRNGEDCVTYDYETKEILALLLRNGWGLGIGSYSDIASLTFLGVTGFNFGTAYHHEHTEMCFAMKNTVNMQLRRVYGFIAKHQHTLMEWDEPTCSKCGRPESQCTCPKKYSYPYGYSGYSSGTGYRRRTPPAQTNIQSAKKVAKETPSPSLTVPGDDWVSDRPPSPLPDKIGDAVKKVVDFVVYLSLTDNKTSVTSEVIRKTAINDKPYYVVRTRDGTIDTVNAARVQQRYSAEVYRTEYKSTGAGEEK